MSRIRPVLSCVFALALCMPVAARAWESDDDHDSDHSGDHMYDDHDSWDHSWDDHDRYCADDDGSADSAHVQQKLASKFGVEESQIASLRDENLGYGEIDHTLTLAERMPGGITHENVDTVLDMRQDQHMGWGQIAKAQGTTMGSAKREFPVHTDVEPTPVSGNHQTSTAQAPTEQPKSLSRSGKSSGGTAHGSSSAAVHGGKSSANGGSSSSHSARSVASSARPASSGHAYGYGHGSAGGASSSAKANGKAKGLK